MILNIDTAKSYATEVRLKETIEYKFGCVESDGAYMVVKNRKDRFTAIFFNSRLPKHMMAMHVATFGFKIFD